MTGWRLRRMANHSPVLHRHVASRRCFHKREFPQALRYVLSLAHQSGQGKKNSPIGQKGRRFLPRLKRGGIRAGYLMTTSKPRTSSQKAYRIPARPVNCTHRWVCWGNEGRFQRCAVCGSERLNPERGPRHFPKAAGKGGQA